MHSPWTRGVVLAWLGVLCALSATALVKRHSEHLRLRSQLVAEFQQITEVQHSSVDEYFWGSGDSYWTGPSGSPQALAIYLLNRGYANPALERGLLLCEALRVYDWKYLYPRVQNYDLRTRLIDHCLRATTEDPKVDIAVGELSLAAGDYGLAASALRGVLTLAPTPGQLRDVCAGLGISEQHLRGRLACALTMTGDWAGADQQAALAEQAGDGQPPPPGDDYDYYDDYGTDAEKAQRAQEVAERNANLERARDYGLRHDPALLRPLLQLRDSLLAQVAGLPVNSSAVNQLNERLYSVNAALLRAHLLAHEWDAAAAAERALDKLRNDAPYPDTAQLRIQSGLLLTRLAQGQKLGQSADDNVAAKRAELAQTYGPDGDYADESPALRQRLLENEVQYYREGELSGLLEADYLPFLLRTDMFADALRSSGRSLQDVLPEIRAVTQPSRGTYSDGSNGELRWK